MLCEECHQNPATVLISVLVNGEATKRHLCAACMQKMQQDFAKGNIQNFLSSVLSSITSAAREAEQPCKDGLQCSRCGLTFQEFQKTGRLGCAQCYQDFREELKPMLLRIHGRSQHAGRVPLVNAREQEKQKAISDLRRRMDQAVSEENFEEAALIRDQLKMLSAASEGEAKA